jgi:hypothetical protein
MALILLVAAGVMLTLPACTIEYYDDEDDSYEEYADDYYYEDEPDVVFDEFEELQFWGQWFDLDPFGWVWRPTVVLGWRPYENGHWAWDGRDWIWVAYEPFGWATFHYGFWVYDMVWGWVWIPDYEWSPARVQWVVYDEFIAWAPLPPHGHRIGDPWVVTEVDVWHVVPIEHFVNSDIGRYQKSYKHNYRVKNRSSVKYKPPVVRTVEQHTMVSVRPITFDLTDHVTRGDRTVKKITLPDDEARRVSRYREKVEIKIRSADPPPKPRDDGSYQDDRIFKKREKGKDDVRKPPKERPDRPTKDRPTKKDPTKREQKKKLKDGTKKPEKPVKQEPNKDSSDPPKKRPEKKKPPIKKKVKDG